MAETERGISRRGLVGGTAGLAIGMGLAPVAAGAAGPNKVMIVRHAEKPDRDGGPPFGVDADGRQDPDALLPRGWQRAGALARLFLPSGGAPLPAGLARPDALFAAAPTPAHASRRAGMTLSALADLGRLDVDAAFGPGAERDAAAAILRRDGVVLVAWEHKRIADLVAALTDGQAAGPHWPGHRYDVVLVLDRAGARWRLTQVPQLLLAGDSAEPLGPAKG